MTCYHWNAEKDKKLKVERDIGFDDVVEAIHTGGLLDVLDHPNQEQYPGQKIYVISALGYVYLVPYVTEADGNIFLKTIIPSRKARKQYEGDANV